MTAGPTSTSPSETPGHSESPPQYERSALPRWAEAALAGDLDRMAELGVEPSTASPTGERSGVDVQIAIAYLRSGRTEDDFLNDRHPNGPYPSSGAVEKGERGERYLHNIWQCVLSLPTPSESIRGGLDRLDQFRAMIEGWPKFKNPRMARAVLLAICDKAESLDKTTFGLDVRSLAELAKISPSSAQRILADASSGGTRRFLERSSASDERQEGQGQHYRLRVLEALGLGAILGHSYGANMGNPKECFRIAPSRNHPVFINAPGAFGQTGYETLRCFDEPRTQAEACRLRDKKSVGERTFKERVKQLRCEGALLHDEESRKLSINPSFDFDRFAELKGLNAVLDRRSHRHDLERLDRLDEMERSGAVDSVTAAQRREHLERKEATRMAKAADRRLVLPRTEDGRTIDPWTGEIYQADHSPIEVDQTARHQPERSASSALPPSVAKNCACCGEPTERSDRITGLPWGEGCRMQPWLVRIHERQGHTIPPELRARSTHVPTDLDNEVATTKERNAA